jgi:allophanate hydrolase
MTVLHAAEGYDAGDCYSRAPREVVLAGVPRVGVLRGQDRDFAGDPGAAALYDAALAKAVSLGWDLVEIDYAPFRDIALMLYGSAFAAERLAAVRELYETKPEAIHPVVREILDGAAGYSAADAFAAIYRLQALRGVAARELVKCDFLLLPTAPTIYSVAEMLAEPIKANAKLGTYTNFVNFMDLAGIAVPAGFDARGLPFGVTLIGQAFTEASLAAFADELHRAIGAGAGKSRAIPESSCEHPDPEATIVVAGAHLSGMVLNPELLAYGAKLIEATRTRPDYKLFVLATTPAKPGLVRAPGFAGAGIDVEVWAMTEEAFGKFVARLPPPMGIGNVMLDDGTSHPGFLCEAYALEGAADITEYGGWRNYVGRAK